MYCFHTVVNSTVLLLRRLDMSMRNAATEQQQI
jgi:hypothetical protein